MAATRQLLPAPKQRHLNLAPLQYAEMIQQSLSQPQTSRKTTSSLLAHKGVTKRPLLQLRKSRTSLTGLLNSAVPNQTCKSDDQGHYITIDRRYVTDQCQSRIHLHCQRTGLGGLGLGAPPWARYVGQPGASSGVCPTFPSDSCYESKLRCLYILPVVPGNRLEGAVQTRCPARSKHS